MTGLERARVGPDCASDLQLDRHLAGDGGGAALAAHLDACERCAGRAAVLRRELETFGVPLDLPRSRRRTAGLILGAVAAAAVIVIAVRPRTPSAPSDIRPKGADRIGVYVASGDRVRLAGPGEVVAPGDVLQLTYTTARPRYLAVVSIDGAGAFNVYHPPSGAAQIAEPGTDEPLPVSVALDHVLGRETLFGVFCDRPFDPTELAPRGQQVVVPPGCRVDRFVVDKRRSP